MTFRDFSETSTQTNAAMPEPGTRRHGIYRHGAKRGFDILFVLLTLPISLPLILGMMYLVALNGGSPIYRQKRLGRDGRIFQMLKIRTMVPGAEALLGDYLGKTPEALREWNETQKLKCDPRITRIGAFLRKSSLDELPQLVNVLVGDMSLIGPRPMMVDQKALYPGTAYFHLRPGITGPWQVSDRNQTSFAARAGYDARYLASMSFILDVVILLKTVRVVLRGTGY